MMFRIALFISTAILLSACGPKGTAEHRDEIRALILEADSLLEVAKELPDSEKAERLARKITQQYRFFYENYAEIEPDSILMNWLSGLEASRKYINRFSNEGEGFVNELQTTREQLIHLERDYHKGLLNDSTFLVYLADERAHFERTKIMGLKRIFPVIYYVKVMDEISSPLDSTIHYHESRMRL
jgi:predicted secreted protein